MADVEQRTVCHMVEPMAPTRQRAKRTRTNIFRYLGEREGGREMI